MSRIPSTNQYLLLGECVAAVRAVKDGSTQLSLMDELRRLSIAS
jgi:hypothetical protein